MSGELRITPELLRGWPLPRLSGEGDKEERGRVFVIAGSERNPGAALLSGIAALRAGAGKLQIATAGKVAPHVGVAVPEALVLELPASGGALDDILERAALCDAVLVGPGMDETDAARLLPPLLESASEAALVLDAAALTAARATPDLVRKHGDRIALTPHAGEMAALLGCSRDEVVADPARAAERAREAFGATLVLKGAETLILDRDGACRYDGGTIGLATSGSGDTLAGVMAGLLARGAAPRCAAAWAVYLHGEAGLRLERRIGRLGFLARELLAEIPGAMADCERG